MKYFVLSKLALLISYFEMSYIFFIEIVLFDPPSDFLDLCSVVVDSINNLNFKEVHKSLVPLLVFFSFIPFDAKINKKIKIYLK